MKYYNISVNGVAYSVSVEETAAGAAPVAPAAAPAPKAAPAPAAAAAPAAPAAPASAGAVEVKAPMPGNILDVKVAAGASVKAGDVRRAGYATTQYWTTSSADGQSRTYSVTVIRDHETPTAEEAFKPGAAKDPDGHTPAASRDDTTLVSHGYILNGEYRAVKDTDYTIPGGRHVRLREQAGPDRAGLRIEGQGHDLEIHAQHPRT